MVRRICARRRAAANTFVNNSKRDADELSRHCERSEAIPEISARSPRRFGPRDDEGVDVATSLHADCENDVLQLGNSVAQAGPILLSCHSRRKSYGAS